MAVSRVGISVWPRPAKLVYKATLLITSMEITTVSLDKSTRDELRRIKEQKEFSTYDTTVEWLLEEVNANN